MKPQRPPLKQEIEFFDVVENPPNENMFNILLRVEIITSYDNGMIKNIRFVVGKYYDRKFSIEDDFYPYKTTITHWSSITNINLMEEINETTTI